MNSLNKIQKKWSNILALILLCLSGQSAHANLHPAIQYLFPVPGSKYLPVETQIIIRFSTVSPDQIRNLSSFLILIGNQSGFLETKTVISSDRKTIIFKPEKHFVPGETITVQLAPQKWAENKTFLELEYNFTISQNPLFFQPAFSRKAFRDNLQQTDSNLPAQNGIIYPVIQNGLSIPSDFPQINISINDNPDEGYIFINNWVGEPYSMILDNSGQPVWYRRTINRSRDFKVQKDNRLTMLIHSKFGVGGHIALDSTYAVVDSFFAPAGYSLDEHELQVLPNGHYLMIVSDEQPVNMSEIVPGGNPNATVLGNHVAEMDAADNLVFLWRCWENLDIIGATQVKSISMDIF
jgi:hypothetical protein